MRLNVIVPCYKPPEGWETALAGRFDAFFREASGLVASINLIVVIDGVSEHTKAINFEQLKRLLPDLKMVSYEENQGKGYALRKGVESSNADFFLVTDADFPYTIDSMLRITQSLIQHGGVAAGNRDTSYYDLVPPFRRRLSKVLRWALRNIFRQPIDDSQCGLKGFDQRGKEIFLQTTIKRFLFDLEFLMLANNKVNVRAIPVELREGVKFNKVGWKVLATEGLNLLKLLFRS